jgi:hypothetical protein
MGKLGTNGRMLLHFILEKQNVKMCTRYNWIRSLSHLPFPVLLLWSSSHCKHSKSLGYTMARLSLDEMSNHHPHLCISSQTDSLLLKNFQMYLAGFLCVLAAKTWVSPVLGCFCKEKEQVQDLRFSCQWSQTVTSSGVQYHVSIESQLTFQRNILPPSSRPKNKPSPSCDLLLARPWFCFVFVISWC